MIIFDLNKKSKNINYYLKIINLMNSKRNDVFIINKPHLC